MSATVRADFITTPKTDLGFNQDNFSNKDHFATQNSGFGNNMNSPFSNNQLNYNQIQSPSNLGF
jgi:hypothetical protein